MVETLGPIKQGEIKRLRFNFEGDVEDGVAIESVAITSETYRGTDQSPASTLVGLPAVVGRSVFQLVQAPEAGSDVALKVKATAADGTRHVIDCVLVTE